MSENKIWGNTTLIFDNSTLSMYMLNIIKGGCCSRHWHKAKWNLFYVISGILGIDIFEGDSNIPRSIVLESGKSYLIKPGVRHRFKGILETQIIEVNYTQLDPEDIIRENVGSIEE